MVKVNNVYTYVPEPSTLIKYDDNGVLTAIIGAHGIVQLDDNIIKMVSLGNNILIVSKSKLMELSL